MNERVTLSGVTIDPVSLGGGTRRDPWQTLLETIPDRSDPVVSQRLAQLYIETEVKEMTAFRASVARQRGDQPGPEGSVNKVFNAELNQRRTNFAAECARTCVHRLGDHRQVRRRPAVLVPAGRANTIEGGTSEVLRNQIAERILGLPRDIEVDKGTAWSEGKRN